MVAALNQQLAEPELAEPAPLEPQPWRESHWSYDLNYAYEHYPKGHYARLRQLQERASPWLKPLYQREGTFVREFTRAFVAAKFDTWAAAIHTGPVGKALGHLGRPYGYGGGQLSVFWTPATGSVLVGRRRGVQGEVFDTYTEWRSWPLHALTGLTARGELVSSSRIEQPQVESQMGDQQAVVRVSGVMPQYNPERTAVAPSPWHYERLFEVEAQGLKVRTAITSREEVRMAELYETLPVFLRENLAQEPARIRFRMGNSWENASSEPQRGVGAIRMDRFDGGVEITFDRPRTVRLSPQVWTDGFQTRAECRPVLVDLLEDPSRPAELRSASIEYTIGPLAAGPP